MLSINNDNSDGNNVLLTTKNVTELDIVKDRITQSFEQVKEQFEDHLVAINENTNEIQSNFEYLCELDSKIDRLAESVEKLTMLIKSQNGAVTEEKKFKITPLTEKEKDVFYALYVLTEGKKLTAYKDVSRRVGYTENLVSSYVTSLIEKGIPVLKKYSGNKAYLGLDDDFRQIQAKNNIVGINSLLTHWIE